MYDEGDIQDDQEQWALCKAPGDVTHRYTEDNIWREKKACNSQAISCH